MTSTPPVLSRAPTPSTPRYGPADDSPYTLRKSTRLAKQRATCTPSPTGFNLSFGRVSPSQLKRSSATHTISPPSSPQMSPPRTSHKPPKWLASKCHGKHIAPDHLSVPGASMLPTPVKTPRKKLHQQNLASAARILFPTRPDAVEEATPGSHKDGRRVRKYHGLLLGRLGDDDDTVSANEIEIFTDSKEKIPEVDESEDNPFYVKPKGEIASRTRSAKRKREVDVPWTKEVQQALARDEGMIYIYRGKKIYRKFGDDYLATPSKAFSGRSRTALLDVSSTPTRFTRSSIKPRRLFPRDDGINGSTTDEEAVTDIEDTGLHGVALEKEQQRASTPTAMNTALATPPATRRSTRFVGKKPENAGTRISTPEPVVRTATTLENSSPFDGWTRGKSSARRVKKRAGDELKRLGKTKRVRGSTAQSFSS